MKVHVFLTLSGLALLTSCGSDTAEPGDEGPIAPPTQSNAPRLVSPPALPANTPQAYQQESMFRVSDVTSELPEEKALLTRPVSSAPSAPVNLNSQ